MLELDGTVSAWPPVSYTAPLGHTLCTAVTEQDLELLDRYYMSDVGEHLDQWQVELIRAVWEIYPPDWHVEALRGKLRYADGVCILIGRQTGKTTTVGAIAFLSYLKSIAKGGRTKMGVIAQAVENANVMHNRIKQPFIAVPALKRRFSVTGYRGITAKSKDVVAELKVHASDRSEKLQSIPFNSSGGWAVLLDELHLQKTETHAALLLGLQAQQDTGLIGISTAGDETSELLIRLQQVGEEAVAGQHERFGFFRWYSPDEYDLYDPTGIALANPAVACGRIDVQKVLANAKLIPEAEWSRYCLNRNGSSQNSYLPASLFAQAGVEEGISTEHKQRCVIAVDRTSDYGYASFVAAKKIDGVVHVELIAQIKDPTSPNLVKVCKKLYKMYKCEFVMDASMLRDVWMSLKEKEHIPVYFYNMTEIANATSQTYALFADHRINHVSDPVMVGQRKHAMTKALGDQFALSVKDSTGDIDSIRAMVLAAHRVEVSERNRPTALSA